ncbi:MAG TPA: hypothetical protein VF230_14540 [Acidimicrobiales bacterium]
MLEETLTAARAGGDRAAVVNDVRRSFRSVASALATVGAIDGGRAAAIVQELDDALALRGIVASSAFAGRAFPAFDPSHHPVRRQGDGWLESEIEHHLDLIVDFDPAAHPDTGAKALASIAPVVRALQAVGALRRGERRLADLAATLAAAGFDVEGPQGEVDRGWLGYLRARPRPTLATDTPAKTLAAAKLLGTVGGVAVSVVSVGWSDHLLDVEVAAPSTQPPRLRCSVFDDAGQLHLAAGPSFGDGGQDPTAPVTFRLRPGLTAEVRSMSVRVTAGAERLEDQVWL